MNELQGIIESIDHDEDMSLVNIRTEAGIMSALILETPVTADYLKTGRKVTVFFKESEVAVAKNLAGEISLRNRFESTVKKIRTGGIMSEVTFDLNGKDIVSLITKKSLERLSLKEGEKAEWLIKATEVALRDEEGQEKS